MDSDVQCKVSSLAWMSILYHLTLDGCSRDGEGAGGGGAQGPVGHQCETHQAAASCEGRHRDAVGRRLPGQSAEDGAATRPSRQER